VVAGLEGDDQDRHRAVTRARDQGLVVVEQAAVRRPEAGLGEVARRQPGIFEVVERDRGRGAEARPVLQAHPGAGDHAQGALRADEEPVRGHSGAVAGQPPRLDRSGRCQHAQSLDEVVDVGEQRGVMAS
jgi:hypothetical protein